MEIRFLYATYLSCGHYGCKSQSTESANCVRNKELTNCCNLEPSNLKFSSVRQKMKKMGSIFGFAFEAKGEKDWKASQAWDQYLF